MIQRIRRHKTSARARGANRTTPGRRIRHSEVSDILALTSDPDPKVRMRAVHELCPCQVRADYEPVWDRILEMTSDPDLHVRKSVFHALTDGSPRGREDQVVAALKAMREDLDLRFRRSVRKLLVHYERTGRYNIG
jgi:hypothetical protein